MIKQKAKGLNSRSEANPYNNGFLPLITAPMNSVVNEETVQIYLDNKINVCLPRGEFWDDRPIDGSYFESMSLDDFISFVKHDVNFEVKHHICIDVANGAMSELHKAIKDAKDLRGDNLIIMAGNVGSVEAFIELAKTGVDYIRVGIGGGGGCHTTRNTGVGQECLETLISKCYDLKDRIHNRPYLNCGLIISNANFDSWEQKQAFVKVKIVADGISSYIKQCEEKYNFNDNGYAAIIKLLHAGADLVMIGRLFAQCEESAGDKKEVNLGYPKSVGLNNVVIEAIQKEVLYSGMSTRKEQGTYSKTLKPSEGSTTWLPVRWSLREWLHGRSDQDQYPFINGFVNSLKSAMSYRGSKTLKEFKQ